MYFVYIIYSESLNKYYVGFTADIEHRLIQHNSNHKGFTASKKDWKVKYSEKFNSKEEALNREKEIKKWKSRIKIEKLISPKS